MFDQELREPSGRIVGRIRRLADGTLEARAPTGRVMGRYDPRTDRTRDPCGVILGRGSRLAALLVDLRRRSAGDVRPPGTPRVRGPRSAGQRPAGAAWIEAR